MKYCCEARLLSHALTFCEGGLVIRRRVQPLHVAGLLLRRATCRAMQGILEGAVADCGAVLALAAPLLAGKVLASQGLVCCCMELHSSIPVRAF